MDFIFKLLILYERKLKRHKIGYVSTNNGNIEKHANIILVNTYPSFPNFYYINDANLGLDLLGDVSVMGCKINKQMHEKHTN